ncbi:MAG: ATPase domain-containing protein [Chloroflexota bacterium]
MPNSATAAPEWLETGIPHLDSILGGGLLRGSLALVIGAPGSGKTIMAEQIAFHGAAAGGAALILTGYSETHAKLLTHTSGLSFFKPDLIGAKIQFASLLDLLRTGSEETEDAIVATARSQHASLVVIDGFGGMRRMLADDQGVAQFLYSLGAKLTLLGATTLVVLEGDPNEASRFPELTISDVILALRREQHGSRERRLLEVVKARGSAPLKGIHPYTIDGDGLSIFPRFESLPVDSEPAWNPARAGFGNAGIDAMFGGGLNGGTAMLAGGSPGVGKTLLGLHFMAEGARLGEPTLFLGFLESLAQLREQARVFGMDLEAAERTGQARFLMLPAHDLEADYIAGLLYEDIERRGVRRLVIDSAAELERAIGATERKSGFLSALVTYLRSRQVTTYLTLDIPTIAGPTLEFAETPLSLIAENLVLLRNVEYRGHLHLVLGVLKMRFSDHERGIYEYAINAGRGFEIVGPAPLGEGLLTGVARPLVDIPLQSQPGSR